MFGYLNSLTGEGEHHRGLPRNAFERADESDDSLFYARERPVSHLDSTALQTIKEVIAQLVMEEQPVILDLMASCDSHIPDTVQPAKVVGLGLNESELSQNEALSEFIAHDLNRDPALPFDSDTFDVVLCTASVDYLTHPLEVFREVVRILSPGGLFLVIFSNRFFPPKVVRIWRECSEEERVLLVADFFAESPGFEQPRTFVSRGKPRPRDDEYAHLGIPSDPVYAVYAEKRGRFYQERRISVERRPTAFEFSTQEIERRKSHVSETFHCPYCDQRLDKWEVPDTPFVEWSSEFQYICFNDECGYFVGGWGAMATQGNPCSYRFMYDPPTGGCHAIPVLSREALRDGIIGNG